MHYKLDTRTASGMDVDEVMDNWSDIESEDSEKYNEESEESTESSESSEEEQEEEGTATAQDSWTEVIGL